MEEVGMEYRKIVSLCVQSEAWFASQQIRLAQNAKTTLESGKNGTKAGLLRIFSRVSTRKIIPSIFPSKHQQCRLIIEPTGRESNSVKQKYLTFTGRI
jgi:hypothetical protein